MQKDVVFGLQQGTNVLKQIHGEMGGIDKVEKLMGETADAVAYQREVSEMLAGQMSNQDEEEVEDELERMEGEVVGVKKDVRVQDGDVDLPAVPQSDIDIAAGVGRREEGRREHDMEHDEAMLA